MSAVIDDGAFWDDLASDLADPEFQRAYATESELIAEVDAAINAEAVSVYYAFVANPARGMSVDELGSRLAERRRLSQ